MPPTLDAVEPSAMPVSIKWNQSIHAREKFPLLYKTAILFIPVRAS